MLPTARTSVELFNVLIAQGRSVAELKLIATCYRFASEIYAGYHMEVGPPFMAHATGTACIAAGMGLSADFVGVALLHNLYANADFGDGRGNAVTPRRRRQVRRAVGERIEALLVEFRDVRRACHRQPDPTAWCSDLSGDRRELLLIEIADHLDHLRDGRVAYLPEDGWSAGRGTGPHVRLLATAATLLGENEVAREMTEALDASPAIRRTVPEDLRRALKMPVPALLLPASAKRRTWPVLVTAARAARVRVGRLLRQLRSTLHCDSGKAGTH